VFTQLDLCSVSGRVVPRLNNVWEKNDLVYLLKASLQTVVATISFNVHVCYFSRILASMLFCFCPRKNLMWVSTSFLTILKLVVIFKIPSCFSFFVVNYIENEEIEINPRYKSYQGILDFKIVYFSYCSNLKLHFNWPSRRQLQKPKKRK
jgi:hypothetical protein